MFSWPKSMPLKEKKELLQAAGINGGWRQLKQDIIRYNELREQVVEQMENKKDPLYQRYLQLYKESLTPNEFMKNRLKIYAICNQRAMQECLSVDEMVNVVSYGFPQTGPLNSVAEDLTALQDPRN